MITYAKLKDLENKKFQMLHKEVTDYHKKADYMYDWSRQWEYPWLLQYVPFSKEKDVLDAGGGTCHFPCLVARRSKSVTVVDLSKEKVFNCEEFKIDAISQDLSKLNISKQYDIVLCVSVLEHITNYFNVIKNLARVVKKDGYLAMTLDLYLNDSENCKKIQIQEIIEILKKENFDIGDIDLSENNLYEKKTLEKMKLDLPNLYNQKHTSRTSLGIIVQKK